MKPKVLIICFTFPPYPGIGGRRWAKFAKYLSRKGCDVRVLAARKTEEQDSQWLNDIAPYQNNIFYIPTAYPLILTLVPKGILQKIQYRIALIYVRIFIKGNYYDHASGWKKHIVKSTEAAIREGYRNIIVSCGPFSTAAFIAELKPKYPELNFMLDLRDPWTTNQTSFGFSGLSPKRMAIEKGKEKFSTETYNYVMTVSDEMTDYFYSISGRNDKEHFFTLINGFDADDFAERTNEQRSDGKLRFVFTGTLYNKSMHIFKEFCDILRELEKENAPVFNALRFDFYGTVPSSFFEMCDNLNNVRFHGTLPMQKVYSEIRNSDIAMLFLTDDLNYSFSTKFYEYISQKIPIAVFSREGNTGQFVVEQRLGYACFSGQLKASILNMHSDWSEGHLVYSPAFDTYAFSVEKLSEAILERLV